MRRPQYSLNPKRRDGTWKGRVRQINAELGGPHIRSDGFFLRQRQVQDRLHEALATCESTDLMRNYSFLQRVSDSRELSAPSEAPVSDRGFRRGRDGTREIVLFPYGEGWVEVGDDAEHGELTDARWSKKYLFLSGFANPNVTQNHRFASFI